MSNHTPAAIRAKDKDVKRRRGTPSKSGTRERLSGYPAPNSPRRCLGSYLRSLEFNCQHAASGFNRQTSMTVAIEYRPLFWPWKITKPFALESEMKPDGTWYWKLV
jgi:hypothetical protein